ncbi:Lysylphosphatidylglycerol synthase TM region [uncultured archaeon]|nr:Lysylphosphatidylglycerol synthase TM region [uncultured archaeon]
MKLGNVLLIARFIAIVIILWLIDFGKLAIILRSINLNLIALAFLLELAGFLIWTLKWKFLVDKLEKIRFTILFLGLMGGNCLNTNVLRARTFGGFGRAMFLRNVTRSHKNANWYATIAIDQTTNIFVFSFPVIFSLLFVFLFLNIPRWLSVILETIVLIIFFLAFAAFLLRRKFDKTIVVRLFYSTLRRIYNFSLFTFIRKRFETYNKFEELIESSLEEFTKTSKSILKDRSILARDLVLSAFVFALIYSKAYLLFQSVGFNISISHLIVSLSLILWLNSILPVPGGFGVKELVMISIYAMVGIPVTIAAIVSLIDRAIYMFFVIILAYLAIIFMRIFHIGEAMQ